MFILSTLSYKLNKAWQPLSRRQYPGPTGDMRSRCCNTLANVSAEKYAAFWLEIGFRRGNILSCEKAIQLACGRLMVLLRCPLGYTEYSETPLNDHPYTKTTPLIREAFPGTELTIPY